MKVRVAIVFYCLFLLLGCSRNGIEGTVQYFGINKPASGVKIEAKTNTDIKEEQSRASLSATTDSTGHFLIRGLLPNKSYQIKSGDSRFDSNTIYEDVPEKGTKIINQPLIVCPIPPSVGIWYFDDTSSNFNRVLNIMTDTNKKVPIRIHEGIIGGGFGNYSAFSVDNQNINSVVAVLPRKGLLIIAGGELSSIGQLFKQPNQVLARTTIPEGWYYNIVRFYEEDFMIVGSKILKVQVQKPNLEKAYKSNSTNHSIMAYSLDNFSSGFYLFVTDVASGQRASQVLFGENQIKEGFIVKIE